LDGIRTRLAAQDPKFINMVETRRDRAKIEKLSAESIIKTVTDLKGTACRPQHQRVKSIGSAAIRRRALLIGWGVAGVIAT